MDLHHLANIGLLSVNIAHPGTSHDNAEDLDVYFAAHGEVRYLQKIFQVQYRPGNVTDFARLLEWLNSERTAWPDLQGVRSRAEANVDALNLSFRMAQGSLAELDRRIHECQSKLRDCFANSDLCESLMRGEALWKITHMNSIFVSKASQLPKPVCGHSRYTQLKWTEEHDGRIFLSIDMREANMSALRIMASLVDPSLYDKIRNGWIPFLDLLLGDESCLVRELKTLREVVLGGLERAWLRRQSSLKGISGIDSPLQECDGATFLRRALGDEDCSPGEEALYRKAFKQLRGRISSAYTEVEHLMIEHIASTVLDNLKGLQFFAMVGDEAIFLLDAKSCTEADEMSYSVSQVISRAFVEERVSLAHAFRVETFCVLKVGKDVMATQTPGTYLALTRRFLEPGRWEAYPQFKGIRKDESRLALSNCVTTLRSMRSNEWKSWLHT